MIPGSSADIVTAEAAKLIWGNVARQVGMPNMSASEMCTSIRPVYGIVWNRTIVDNVATKRINDEPARLRNSALPPKDYQRLVAMFLESYHSANSSPSELWAWRLAAERFRLDTTFGWGPVLELCSFLHTKGIWMTWEIFLRNSFICSSKDAPHHSSYGLCGRSRVRWIPTQLPRITSLRTIQLSPGTRR